MQQKNKKITITYIFIYTQTKNQPTSPKKEKGSQLRRRMNKLQKVIHSVALMFSAICARHCTYSSSSFILSYLFT